VLLNSSSIHHRESNRCRTRSRSRSHFRSGSQNHSHAPRNLVVSLEIRIRWKTLWAILLLATTDGKRDGPSLNMASNSSRLTRRLFVTDRNTISFLVDTGADLYIYPRKLLWDPRHKSDYVLSAVNGTINYTYDTEFLTLNLGLCAFTWRFVVTDVSRPIIGTDFLSFYELLVDLWNNQLTRWRDCVRWGALFHATWLVLREDRRRSNQES